MFLSMTEQKVIKIAENSGWSEGAGRFKLSFR